MTGGLAAVGDDPDGVIDGPARRVHSPGQPDDGLVPHLRDLVAPSDTELELERLAYPTT